jgi:hypothetical protein
MVLELTEVSQLEFVFGFIFVLPEGYRAAAGAVEMWQSGVFVFAGFPSPVERAENSLLGF